MTQIPSPRHCERSEAIHDIQDNPIKQIVILWVARQSYTDNLFNSVFMSSKAFIGEPERITASSIGQMPVFWRF